MYVCMYNISIYFIIVQWRMSKSNQFFLSLLLRKQGKPVIYNDDIYCTYIL